MSRWAWLYVAFLVGASAISAGLIVYAWRHRDRRGAVPLLVTFVGSLVWEVSSLAGVLAAGTPTALLTTQTTTVGASLTVIGFFLFALSYTGREEIVTLRLGLLLSVVPAAGLTAKVTNPLHGYYWTSIAQDSSELMGYAIEYGPAFFGFTLYSYALLFVGTVLILDYATDAASIYRYQTTAILTAVVVPWVGNALLVVGVVDADLTPIAFSVSGVALWWAIFRAEFLDLAPIGREAVVADLYDGVFTIDPDHRLVDLNPTGRKLFGFEDGDDIVGQHVDDLLAGFPEIRNLYWEEVEADGDTEFEAALGSRHYHVEVLRLGEGSTVDAGRTIHVRDVTEQKRRERELERKNERLERFASIVSHDLRNPLNVIQGRVEMAEHDDGDVGPHLEHIATNADRIEAIIEDVLAMTREGELRTRERVDVAAVARRAWDHVATADATLETPTDATVEADSDRLVQAFENLFRNAVEHGSTSPDSQARRNAVDHAGPDVTVTVGTLDDGAGFFVADDGPGIPAEERDAVLEDGYTTSECGTGLGLSIVAEIVDAHGWDLTVTDASTTGGGYDSADGDAPGGARFEIACESRAAASATDGVTVDPTTDASGS
ncbi:histidine kinase N-terminal 7TM domain-containing protein [Halorientalis marina]|uniref:histidine kinase N-terminal 7TM domain-containing protein n=1 Tax=Halorientalis marina TaxID=2931976 RepID=UPI001FF2CAB6|nr:histidine kinase N-terminal 7TM domain-containing protein [Halorientalis marina]